MPRATERAPSETTRAQRVALAFGALALLGALVGTSVAATARVTYWGEIIVNLSGYVGLSGLAAALALGVARRWRLAVLGAAVCLYHGAPLAALYLGGPQGAEQGGGPQQVVRLAGANLHYENEDASGFLGWLDSAPPDVLGVLEVTPFWAGVLAQLDERYPYRLSEPQRPGAFSMQLLSRFPLRDAELHRTPHAWRAYLEAVVDVPGGPLHVVLVHPSRPGRGWGTDERNDYLMQVAEEVRWRPRSVLFGDLNATIWSPIFGDVLSTTGLADSRVGFGWLPSWRSVKHVAGIWLDLDHVLVGPGLRVLERATGPDIGSDHRPALAVLELSGREELASESGSGAL